MSFRRIRWQRGLFVLKEVILVAAIVLFTRTAVAETYWVPTGSMEPTLAVGDRLLVDKFSYGYSRFSLPDFSGLPAILPERTGRIFGSIPERGEIIVFRLPRDPKQTFVKRVIGVPGDRVEVRGGRLWLNGVEMAVRQSDSPGAALLETLPNGKQHEMFERPGWGQFDDTRAFEVPEGHLFVMGDNRDDSLDSRVLPSMGGVGFLPLENVVGRVDLVLASWEIGLFSRPLRDWPAAIKLRRFFSSVQ